MLTFMLTYKYRKSRESTQVKSTKQTHFTMGDGNKHKSNSKENVTNELVADQIQREWKFRLKRSPENIVVRFGIVPVILGLLELLLIISNNFHYLGFWDSFITESTRYRRSLTHSRFGRTAHLDSGLIAPYSLWRGWVVPAFLGVSIYIIVGVLSLRHELYHWKPELLEHYFSIAKASKFGKYLPESWLNSAFHAYNHKYHKAARQKLQNRTHTALQDSREFLKVLKTVALNLLLSIFVILLFWIFLLAANIEADSISQLPPSHVPPIQFFLWYLTNDIFYFYPHWIAHQGPSTNASYLKYLPSSLAEWLHNHLNTAHKLHHRTKANLGLLAWHCTPTEHILLNLTPALLGPLLTQILLPPPYTTHLVTYYTWIAAATANSVLAHTGFRSWLNDPGKHDLHHERAFDPRRAVNFGTMGMCDWVHGTASVLPIEDAKKWRAQRGRQAALWEASRRTGVSLSIEQMNLVMQPDQGEGWVEEKSI